MSSDHRSDRRAPEQALPITSVNDSRKHPAAQTSFTWVTLTEEQSIQAEEAKIVQRLHYRDSILFCRVIRGRRDERKCILKMNHTRTIPADHVGQATLGLVIPYCLE